MKRGQSKGIASWNGDTITIIGIAIAWIVFIVAVAFWLFL